MEDKVYLEDASFGPSTWQSLKSPLHHMFELSTVWKKVFGVNIYGMGACFLFEFPNRDMAVQILQGEWIWKKNKVKLELWNPSTGCVPASCKPKTKWIRAMGLALHLYSNETFHEIGDLCGGWKLTEEEAELRNHFKWARIEVRGDGRYFPNEVTISRDESTSSSWSGLRKTRFKLIPTSSREVIGEDELEQQTT